MSEKNIPLHGGKLIGYVIIKSSLAVYDVYKNARFMAIGDRQHESLVEVGTIDTITNWIDENTNGLMGAY